MGQGIIGVPEEEEAVPFMRGGNQRGAEEVGNGHEGQRKGAAEACWEVKSERNRRHDQLPGISGIWSMFWRRARGDTYMVQPLIIGA